MMQYSLPASGQNADNQIVADESYKPRASRRLTRADIPQLPKDFLKGTTPAVQDTWFDEDGFMLPRVQGEVERLLISQHCFVCGKRSKHRCSKCERISYCSSECQRIHWKAHKPECMRVTDSDTYMREYCESAGEYSAMHNRVFEIGDAMHKRGRHFRNVRLVMVTWLSHVKYFAKLELKFDEKKSYAFDLCRRDGRLVILEEGKEKNSYGRVRSERSDVKVPDERAQKNVPAYIARSIERWAKELNTVFRLYLHSTLVPVDGNRYPKFDDECEIRGATCAYIPGTGRNKSWYSVTQWEPETFGRLDTEDNVEAYKYRHYVW